MNSIQYPTDQQAKEWLVEIGKRMYDQGYVVTNDGNISLKVSENEIWVTPTGVSKGFMTPDIMVKMNLQGDILEGNAKPSSEVKMHIRVFTENPNVNAVVHAHPVCATAFAIAGIPLEDPFMVESAIGLGVVPVARYATTGTQEVPDSIAPFCKEYGGVLLSNHGALTWGRDILQAYYRMETLENYAKTTFLVKNLGGGRLLSQNQMDEIEAKKEPLGILDGVMPKGVEQEQNTTDVMPKER